MEDFYVEKYVNESNFFYTTYDVTRVLISRVIGLCNKCNGDTIVTNGNIASILQDTGSFTINSVRPNGNVYIYPLGNLARRSIYVNAFMRWDDNRILIYKKNEEVIERVYSETDPYGEENWNDTEKSEREFDGELLETLMIHDEKGILI